MMTFEKTQNGLFDVSKPFFKEEFPRKNRGRVGLAVMRTQPVHLGHTWIISEMCYSCETVIVAQGSCNESGTEYNPWTEAQRRQMIRNVFGDRVKLVPLTDIGAEQGSNDWCDYVLAKIRKVGLPDPTDYYTGSHADAQWYKGRFWVGGDEKLKLLKSEYRDPYYVKYEDGAEQLRLLHIMNRDGNPIPPATDIRTFLKMRTDQWKQWVPAVNHELVESTFPENLKIKLESV